MTATDDGEIDAASTRFLISDGAAQTTLPATASNGSYAADWTPAAGSYTVAAQASDTTGLSTTSSPARSVDVVTNTNTPPTIAWVEPGTGATFTPGSNITLRANASDADGTISKVEFFKDNGTGVTLLGTATGTTSPYTLVWLNAPAGNYTLIARATDDLGVPTDTPPITIEVAEPAMCFALPARPGSVR